MNVSSLTSEPTNFIAVVDDDASVRQALHRLIKSAGYDVETFANVHDFLQSPHFPDASCLILDIQMPGLSGWDLQSVLRALNVPIPTIFITAQQDEDIQERALATGALGFLHKPFDDQSLVSLLEKAPHLPHAHPPSH